MHKIKLALALSINELRFGWKHFKVFLACLTLGVTVMACVNSLGSVVETALQNEAKSLVGGDIGIELRGVQASPEQRDLMAEFGATSFITTLRTMLYADDEATLVEVKAIDAAYPLVGNLEFKQSIPRSEIFAQNGVAVDAILLSQLDLKIGDTIRLGQADYIIRATLAKEPDRAVQIFSFGPRVMMTHQALEKSGLVSTFGLIDHQYRILSSTSQFIDQSIGKTVKAALDKRFPNQSWRVSNGGNNNRLVRRFTDQLLSFLSLSALATFLIAGIGIASSVRSYLGKKLQTIAVLKTLGGSRSQVALSYVLVLSVLALLSGTIGVAIAWAIVSIILPLLAPILPVLEGQTSITILPMLLAVWYGVLITFLFSIPALYSAVNIKPSLLFRTKSGIFQIHQNARTLLLIAFFAMLLILTLLVNAQDKQFIIGALGMIGCAFFIFTLCTYLVKDIARRIKPRTPWLKLAIGNLYRPGATTGTVIYAIGISLMVLIALLLTEANLQSRITKLVEEQAPSLFLVDVQPHQKEPLQQLLQKYTDPENIMIYPMIRAMITKINGEAVDKNKVDPDVSWAIRGDRGVSYASKLPSNAVVVEGQWWPEDYKGKPLISVDERFMDGLGLEIGSTLSVNILGEEITATVASARVIDYSSFQINFSLMLSPGILEEHPKTFLATIYLENNEETLVRQIAKELPGITIVRTQEVLDLVREVIGYISIALRISVAVSLFAGILVLIAALSATVEQRLYDIAVFKVLGARKSDILKSCTAEWMLLALITSIIAAIIGTVSAYFINLRFRAVEFDAMPEITLLTIVGCIIVILLTGYLTNNRLFSFRPSTMLRND